jgi:hypothetical protein
MTGFHPADLCSLGSAGPAGMATKLAVRAARCAGRPAHPRTQKAKQLVQKGWKRVTTLWKDDS